MCFTPEVTATTAVIEIVFALWTWTRYQNTKIGRISAKMLLFLGGYQFTELMICVGGGFENVWWGRIGFLIITFLPMMAVHAAATIEHELNEKKQYTHTLTNLVPYGYGIATILGLCFLLLPQIITDAQCAPYYILYQRAELFFVLYSIYYGGFIALGFSYFISLLGRTKGPKQQACLWLAIGYLSFVIPTFVVTTVFPYMNIGFPSVFCGFAIFLAFILVGKVLPLYHEAKKLQK